MGEGLRLYEVTVGNNVTRMRLNEADAAAWGDRAVLVQSPATAETSPKARLGTPNKMRSADESPAVHVSR